MVIGQLLNQPLVKLMVNKKEFVNVVINKLRPFLRLVIHGMKVQSQNKRHALFQVKRHSHVPLVVPLKKKKSKLTTFGAKRHQSLVAMVKSIIIYSHVQPVALLRRLNSLLKIAKPQLVVA